MQMLLSHESYGDLEPMTGLQGPFRASQALPGPIGVPRLLWVGSLGTLE